MTKIKHYLKEIAILFIMVFITLNAVSYYRSLDLNKDKFPIENIVLEEKPLLVYFWATWCPICKIVSPSIEKISKDYQVLSIAIDSGTHEEIQDYLKKNNLTFDYINDEDYTYLRKFNIQVFPTTIIYDKYKNVVFTEVGYTSHIGLIFRMWWASL